MGAELCLAHDMGGGGIWGALSVDMQPYGCFIFTFLTTLICSTKYKNKNVLYSQRLIRCLLSKRSRASTQGSSRFLVFSFSFS